MARVTYRIRRVDEADSAIADTLEEMHTRTFTDGTHLPVVDGLWMGDWWLAYYLDAPVAFAGMTKADPHYAHNAAYLCRVGVLKEHRGNGLQKRLIRAIERHAARLKFSRIVSDTTNNPPSANSFIACGYKTFKPTAPWSFDRAVYWRKEL
jgi:GNAT superfamily N-acetyltransferase